MRVWVGDAVGVWWKQGVKKKRRGEKRKEIGIGIEQKKKKESKREKSRKSAKEEEKRPKMGDSFPPTASSCVGLFCDWWKLGRSK